MYWPRVQTRLMEVCRGLGYRIIIIIILFKQDYKIQLANNKIQMAWLTGWLVVGVTFKSSP